MQDFCNDCGFPFDSKSLNHCPKCGETGSGIGGNQLLEIDVVHDGQSWEGAKKMIESALQIAMAEGNKGLKVIHGYGSFSGVSVIAPQAISLMRHLAESHNGRFAKDHENPGVSLIWLNRKRTREVQREVPLKSPRKNQLPLGGNWFDEAVKRSR